MINCSYLATFSSNASPLNAMPALLTKMSIPNENISILPVKKRIEKVYLRKWILKIL